MTFPYEDGYSIRCLFPQCHGWTIGYHPAFELAERSWLQHVETTHPQHVAYYRQEALAGDHGKRTTIDQSQEPGDTGDTGDAVTEDLFRIRSMGDFPALASPVSPRHPIFKMNLQPDPAPRPPGARAGAELLAPG